LDRFNAHSHNRAFVPIYKVRNNQQRKERYAEMNSENDDTDDTNDDIPWFETEAAAFIGAAAAGKAAGLPARVVQRIRRRAKPDRLLENFIFGFFRSGLRVAFYLACAYAAKIALGMGYLSFALR
jgi:hypothetical protein